MIKNIASESVTEGHPDKMCDQISDAILDEILKQDKNARVAVETMATNNLIHIAGEVTTKAKVDFESIARKKILEIGFDSNDKSLDGNTCGIIVSIGKQSSDIAMGVDKSLEAKNGNNDLKAQIGAGDQGLMYGYATNENTYLMPAPITLSHILAEKLAEYRKNDGKHIYPDGKAQVIVQYEDGKPVAINNILISTQHDEYHSSATGQKALKTHVQENVILPAIQTYNEENPGQKLYINKDTQVLINPTGNFNIGSSRGDAGLTGRKIIVDTYGGMARHGGGAFSGKDPSKVDRSAAYALRWVAKNVVAAGLADKCEIQVSYAIGKAEPLGLYIDTFGTAKVNEENIMQAIRKTFDLRPQAIIESLKLKDITKYQQVAKYGHFGRNAILNQMPWEETNKINELLKNIEG